MPEPFNSRLGEIMFKAETAKGTQATDANLVDGTFSNVRAFDVSYTPDVRFHDRRIVSNSLSRNAHILGQTLGRITFKTELVKLAATATQDRWGPLLEACGCPFTSGTGVYAPTTDRTLHKTLTMYVMTAGSGTTGNNTIRVGMRGCAGTFKLVGKPGLPAMLEWEFFGVSDNNDADATPSWALKFTDDALNTVTHDPVVAASFHGIALTWNAFSAKCSTMEFDAGNVVVPREDLSSDQGILCYAVIDRAPMLKIDPEAVLLTTQAFFTQLVDGTEVAVAWDFVQPATASPSVALRTFAFDAPKAQLRSVTHGDRNGIGIFACEAALNRSAAAGEDEWTLAITGAA